MGNWLRSMFGLFVGPKGYVQSDEASAAAEAAMIFPILLTLLLGVFDMGFGVLAAQKTIRSSQVTADLIARHKTINDSEIDEAIAAGSVALNPFNTLTYGVDIVSIEFDNNSNPQILWRETRNMDANDDAVDSLQGFADPGEGVIVVTVQYTFVPVFAGFVVDDIFFEEVSFTRGRKSPTVPMEAG